MNNNKKLIIQALAVVIFSILLYREWDNEDARFFYVELLCFIEVLVQMLYLFFNRKTINEDERSKEVIATLIYAIVMVALLLVNMVKARGGI